MQDIKTDELEEKLKGQKVSQLETFFMENKAYMADDPRAFYKYMDEVLKSKNIMKKDMYSFAGVSEEYGSKILRMEKHTANRDLIIRFCIAGHFHVEECNRALKLYKMAPLYAKDKRDACLILSISNRKFDLAEIDDILESQGLQSLSVEMD